MSPTFRLARRNLGRSIRSQLIVASLIALATGVGVFLAIAVRSGTVTDADRYANDYGSAQIGITGSQLDGSEYGDPNPARPGQESTAISDAVIADVVAAGGQVLVKDRAFANGPISAQLVVVDLDSPLSGVMFADLEGRAPTAPGEIALSTNAAERLGVTVGDSLETSPGLAATVVGVAQPVLDYGQTVMYLPVGTDLLGQLGSAGWGGRTIGISGLGPAEIEAIIADRASSTVALERASYRLDTDSFTTYRDGLVDPINRPEQAGTLITGLLSIEVGLLAAAAFAIGARRRTTEFGRLTALGAGPEAIVRMMLTEAAIVALSGAIVGAAIALGAAMLWPGLIDGFDEAILESGRHIATIRWSVLDLLGPVALATAAGVISAWLPARRAAGLTATSALADGAARSPAPVRLLPRSLLILAGSLVVVGWTSRLDGQGRAGDGTAALGIAAAVGLVAALIGLASWLLHRLGSGTGSRLPVAMRLAIRDSARHQPRSIAALAGVGALVGFGVFVGSIITAESSTFQPIAGSRLALAAPEDDGLWFDVAAPGTPDPRDDAITLAPGTNALGLNQVGVPGPAQSQGDWVFFMAITPDQRSTTGLNTVVVSDDEMIDALGLSEDAEQALSQEATIVVTDPQLKPRSVQVETVGQGPGDVVGSLIPVLEPVPTLAALGIQGIISEAETRRLGLAPQPGLQLLINEAGFTADQLTDLSTNGVRVPTEELLNVRSRDWWIGQFVALAIIAGLALITYRVITGLVAAETERDVATMVSIGAPVAARKRQLASLALVHLGIAVALSVPIAVVAAQVARRSYDQEFGIEFNEIPLVMVVGFLFLPFVAAAVNGLTTRSVVPAVSRRMT